MIDWTAVLAKLELEASDLEEMPKGAREQAIAEVEKIYGVEVLFEKDPQEVDQIVADTLERILKKKNFFQKREKAKKQNANNLPHVEIFPLDGVPEEFKQMLQDAFDNAQGKDPEEIFNEMLSKLYKNRNKFKPRPKGKDKGKRDDDDSDASRSMYI